MVRARLSLTYISMRYNLAKLRARGFGVKVKYPEPFWLLVFNVVSPSFSFAPNLVGYPDQVLLSTSPLGIGSTRQTA